MTPTTVPPAVATYRAALPPGRLLDFPVTALDRAGVPTWSVTFYPQAAPNAGGHGYGTTDAEAMTSAFGELSEQVHASAATRRLPRRRATYRELLAEVGPRGVLDPVTACLPAGSPYTPDRPLEWVPVTRWEGGETVLAPVELVAFQGADLGPGDWLVTPITNGMGAGPTLEQALAHGLLELHQRDGNSVHFRVMDRGIAVDLDAVTDPETLDVLRRLDAEGIDVLVKLASTDFDLTNLFVVGADRDEEAGDPLMATACGEAAHPDREVALRKALLEYAAARVRKAFTHGPLGPVAAVTPPGYLDEYRRRLSLAGEEERALRTMIEWRSLSNREMRALLADTVLSVRSRVPFSSLPTVAGGEREALRDKGALLRLLTGRLAGAGFDVLYADYSRPDLGVYAVKAIVPGLEVETMTYYNIGPRNLRRLLDREDGRGEGLVGLGAPPPGALPLLLTGADRERLGGPAWLDPAAVDRAVGHLYPLYREPARHAAAFVVEEGWQMPANGGRRSAVGGR